MEGTGDVAIIGAGLIGLGIAFDLAQRGATVRVFEREEPGRAASWAAAGMLAPYTERVDDEDLLRLCIDSLAMYPDFVRRVQEASGTDVQLHLDGVVNAAFDDERMRELTRARAILARCGHRMQTPRSQRVDARGTFARATHSRRARRRRAKVTSIIAGSGAH